MIPANAQYALSIRQPFAWLVANGLRPLDNRAWRTNRKGSVFIHASQKRIEYEDFVRELFTRRYGITLPPLFEYGGIVGHAEVIGCTAYDPSPWFEGPFAIHFANAMPLPFQACRGGLYFFRCEYELAKRRTRKNKGSICLKS